AAAFATACILVVPRLAWFALPLALAIAASRVAAGVHYVHDVLSGLALGALVVAAVVAAASPVLDRRLTGGRDGHPDRSEEHTSELQSRFDLVCRLLLETNKHKNS